MEALAHSPEFARKAGVPSSVGKDFVAADKAAHKYAAGGGTGNESIFAGNEQMRLPSPTILGGRGQKHIITGTPFRPRWGVRPKQFAGGGDVGLPLDWESMNADPDVTNSVGAATTGAAVGAGTGILGAPGDIAEAMGHKPSWLPTSDHLNAQAFDKSDFLKKLYGNNPTEFGAGAQVGRIASGLAIPLPAGKGEMAAAAMKSMPPRIGELLSKIPGASKLQELFGRGARPTETPGGIHVSDASMADFEREIQRYQPGGDLHQASSGYTTSAPGAAGAASNEGINALASEKGQGLQRFMVDRSGSATPLNTVDARDTFAGNGKVHLEVLPDGRVRVHSSGIDVHPSEHEGIINRWNQYFRNQ